MVELEPEFILNLPIINDRRCRYQKTFEEWDALPEAMKNLVVINGTCRERVIVFGENDYANVFISDLPVMPIIE